MQSERGWSRHTQSPQLRGHEAGVHWGSCLHTGSTPTLLLGSCLAQTPSFIPGCKTADSQIRSLEPVCCLFNFLNVLPSFKSQKLFAVWIFTSFWKKSRSSHPGPGLPQVNSQLELPLYKDGTSAPHPASPCARLQQMLTPHVAGLRTPVSFQSLSGSPSGLRSCPAPLTCAHWAGFPPAFP